MFTNTRKIYLHKGEFHEVRSEERERGKERRNEERESGKDNRNEEMEGEETSRVEKGCVNYCKRVSWSLH